jgi:hypothetical protein
VFADLDAAGASEAQRRSQALRSLLRDRVTPQLIAEEISIDEFITANRPFVTRLCAQILVFLDEDLANESATRLQAGDDFVVVATDAGQAAPGRIGALDNSATCPEFASTLDASVVDMALSVPIGEFVGPVPINTGFALMRVTDRHEPPPDVDDLMDHVDSRRMSEFFTPWFNDAVQVAVIEIDPSIGTWSAAGIGIIPPE